MIKPLWRLFLESIGVQIIEYALEILPSHIPFEKDKLTPNKAGLIDDYIIRKEIDIRLIYDKSVYFDIFDKAVQQHEGEHL